MSKTGVSQLEKRPGDSHFWYGLMSVKDLLLQFGKFKVNNGQQTRFLEDMWIDQQPLMC